MEHPSSAAPFRIIDFPKQTNNIETSITVFNTASDSSASSNVNFFKFGYQKLPLFGSPLQCIEHVKWVYALCIRTQVHLWQVSEEKTPSLAPGSSKVDVRVCLCAWLSVLFLRTV